MKQPLARTCAQYLFFVTGFCAVVLFGGVALWAKAILIFLLGLVCLLESTVSSTELHVPKVILILVTCLLGWLLLSLCPWPVSWAKWLAPGQAALMSDLEGFQLSHLHGSMAPQATLEALFALVAATVVIYLSWRWSSSRSFRDSLAAFFLIGGAFIGGLGLIDQLDGSDLIYGFWPARYKHWAPFINRNHFANYISVSVFIGLGIFFRYAFPKKNRQPSFLTAIGGLMISVFCGGMILATASRGALFSLIIGLLAFTILLFVTTKKVGSRVRVMILGLIFSFGLLLAYGRTVLHRTEILMSDKVEAEEGRIQVWKDTWKMTKFMRGRGIGVGAFETVFPAFQTSYQKTITHVENEYLEILTEWGIGSVIFVGFGILLVLQACRTLAQHVTELQIAGWSALIAMATHAMVDFIFHIPANAWLAALLVGMLIRGSATIENKEFQSLHPKFSLRRAALLIIGGFFLVGGWCAFKYRESISHRIEQYLAQRDFQSAWKESQIYRKEWPFYWYGHQLAGLSVAGLPAMNREVERSFHRSQRLFQANPMISFNAGVLFLKTGSPIVEKFFETSLNTSSEPIKLFRNMMMIAGQQENGVATVLSLALQTPERWSWTWGYLEATVRNPDSKLLQAWIKEGLSRWLNDPVERYIILQAMVERGLSEQVRQNLEQNPPRSFIEYYWLGRAYESLSEYQLASEVFYHICKENLKPLPVFKNSIELHEPILRRIVIDPANLALQLKVAETLVFNGRYSESISVWERILYLAPKNLQAEYGMAIAYQQMGEWVKSDKIWRHLVEDICNIH